MTPTDAVGDGMAWQSLGIYQTMSGDLNVTLGDAANGYVIANAVCLAAVPATVSPPTVVDTGDAAYAESPNSGWQSYADPSAYNGDFRYHAAGTGQNTATWTFADVDPTAQYQVYATWTAAGDRADNAPYTISDSGTTLATVDMNQQFAPTDATIGGQGWESLGTFAAPSGTLNVSLSDNADGIVVADAIMIVPVPPPTTAPSLVRQLRRRVLGNGQRLARLFRFDLRQRRLPLLPGRHGPEHLAMDLRQRQPRHGIPDLRHMDRSRRQGRRRSLYCLRCHDSAGHRGHEPAVRAHRCHHRWPRLGEPRHVRRLKRHAQRQPQRQCRWDRRR